MAKAKHKTASRFAASPGPTKRKRKSDDTTTLSVRLTEQERTLLTTAADIRGESPTRLIKSAAISQAAYTVNTSRTTTFNFDDIAMKAATLLFTKEFECAFRTSLHPLPGETATSKDDPRVLSCEEAYLENLEYYGSLPEAYTRHDPQGSEIPLPDEAWLKARDPSGSLRTFLPAIRDDRIPMTREDYLDLRRAVRLGGTDFVKRVLDYGAKEHFGSESIDEPIDPCNFE